MSEKQLINLRFPPDFSIFCLALELFKVTLDSNWNRIGLLVLMKKKNTECNFYLLELEVRQCLLHVLLSSKNL